MNRSRLAQLPSLVRALAFLAIALPCADASAQDLRGWVNGGWVIPSDPPELWELWTGGWSAGGGLGVRVSPDWELGIALHLQRFDIDRAAQIDDLLLSGFGTIIPIREIKGRELTMISLMGEARFHFAPPAARASPFLVFGWGYFRLDEADATVTPAIPEFDPVLVLGASDDAFATTIGAGLEWALTSRISLMADAVYTVGFTARTSAQYLPLRLGVGIR